MDLPGDVAVSTDALTKQNAGRALFLLLVVLSLFVATSSRGGAAGASGEFVDYEVGEQVAPPRNGTVVFTNSQHGNNHLTAVAPNGTIVYNSDHLDIYNDVDPSPAGRRTVLVVGSEVVSASKCDSPGACHRSVVLRVNISTGERAVLWTRTTDLQQNQIHDVDRVGPHRLLVGDIAHDRAFVVNTTTGIVTWGWNAQSEYSLDGGGIFPGDWTHLNDVAKLPDGRYMVNLRNQDQVVFVHPERGLQENWTLGRDDAHGILFEQHNPDYIPASEGGPAVLVADSENNRIVEYQRVDGEWQRTWVWRDARLQWPRDADRLPNGHTLIVDSNGGRVLEVNRAGEVVWSVEVDGVYDAEVLGTGDESAGGPSARRANLQSVTVGKQGGPRDMATDYGALTRGLLWLKDRFPTAALNGILYVAPNWFNFRELVGTVALVVVGLAWALAEWRWSPYELTVERVESAGDEERG